MELSAEANDKAEKAYTAMKECKVELERYKDNTPIQIRPRVKRIGNLHTLTPPCTTSISHRVNGSRRKSRSKSRGEDVIITSILRDSIGSVDMSSIRNGRKLNSSMTNYRDEYRSIHRSVV